MVSLFNALNISSNALTVNESAISVVSHNVANMNTEGYSKQKVHLATRNIAGAIGDSTEAQIRANGGVMIANVMRYNDSYLNNYYRDQLSILKGYEAELDTLGDLEDVFNDLEGEGISAALASFYEAVNNLNEYPASSTARINFIESAKTLTATLNAKSAQLSELTAKSLGDGESQEALEASKIYSQFSVFNDKLEELAEVNKALQITQTGTLEANNLLDQRDMILKETSKQNFYNTSKYDFKRLLDDPSNIEINLYNYINIRKTLRKDDFKALRINFNENILKQIFPEKAYYNLENNSPIKQLYSDEIQYITRALQSRTLIAVTGYLGVGKNVIIQEALSKINKRIITIDALLHETKDLIILEILAQIWGISKIEIFSLFSDKIFQNSFSLVVILWCQ